jgi:hypothetical protein
VNRILPWIAFFLYLLVIGYGLYHTAMQAVKVAPRSDQAHQNRLHLQMKNLTRITGDEAAVYAAVQRAVDPEKAPDPWPGEWRRVLARELRKAGTGPAAGHVVVLPSEGEDAEVWALPGAYWAIYSGALTLLSGPDGLSDGDLESLKNMNLPVYVLAPSRYISDSALDEIRRAAPEVRRIAGGDPKDHAVLLAEYRDPGTGFGWGRTYGQRDGYFHYAITTPAEAKTGFAGLPLARSNAATLLFASDSGGVPAATDRYLWQQRADFFVTPAEGPFRHIFLLGDRTSYKGQARMDLALEKGPYASMGHIAMGPMEGLAIAYIALGIASMLFILIHAWRCLPGVMPVMKLGWAGTSLLVPVLGPILYLASFRRAIFHKNERRFFFRPPVLRAAAATAMSFGFGAPLMITIGWLFVYFGLPLFYGPWAEWGPLFLLGAGMMLMMIGMYLGAVLIAWILVQRPMRLMMPGMRTLWGSKGLTALAVTALSMLTVSLGMMTMSWWMLMEKIPMMPKEDEILWFGAVWLASTIGYLVSWPLNTPLVRAGLKEGSA